MRSTGIADTVYFGAEAEFYVFDDVRFHSDVHSSFYSVDSDEGWWNTDRPGAGGQPRLQDPPEGRATSRWPPTTSTAT